MRYFLIFIFTCISSLSFAQIDVDFDDDPSFKDRIFFGGGLGFSTDNYATVISLSPIAGYMITEKLSAGVGVQYQYINYRFADVIDSRYGGSLFTRYNIRQFFAQVEYNVLNVELTPFDDSSTRVNLDRLLVGGGISQPIGGRARVNVVGFYDILYSPTSLFSSPWVFRVYISV